MRATIGRPSELAARYQLAAIPVFARVRAALADAAERGPDAAVDALVSMRGDEEIERVVMEPQVLADLAGQMFVRLVELRGETRLLSRRVALATDPERWAFLRLPYEEALAWWVERGGSREILDEVIAAWRRRAAETSDEILGVLAERVRAEIERVLRDGATLRDFASAVRSGAVSLGIEPESPWYLETVYRTNVQSAYGAGRWKQMTAPEVIRARPYRQWHAVGDSRTRPGHRALDGVVWRHDAPAFANVTAPGGFNCRCAVVTLSEDDVREMGLTPTDVLPADAEITQGFGVAGVTR